MDNDSSLDFTLSPSFHTARFDSTNYRTCNTRFTNFQTVIFNTTEQLDESDGHSSFKDIVTDFADPESGVFWGAVTETEKQRRNFQAENSSTLMGKSLCCCHTKKLPLFILSTKNGPTFFRSPR